MLCQRCLSRLALAPSRSPALRSLSTSRSPTNSSLPSISPTIRTPFTFSSRTLSSSIALPSPTPQASTPPPPPKSSTKAGTVMKGLAYIKGKENVLAGADEDYPDWLWGLLNDGDKKKGLETEGGEGDLFSKSKKQRRIAAKAARKAVALDPSLLMPKIPLEQQSIDLPAAMFVTTPSPAAAGEDAAGNAAGWKAAQLAREELTHAMRMGRRKGIKEGNFLKGMK